VKTTAERILDVAERLAQTRGFNGFSYADIAAELAIAKPSLHYHFASKAELGRALIGRYKVVFSEALRVIHEQSRGAVEKLKRYVALYDDVIRQDRLCLCGMFAAEYSTLPRPMQQALRGFFDTNQNWLAAVLDQGRIAGELCFRGTPQERAELLVGALEGAMLVARSYNDDKRFRCTAAHLLADLCREHGSTKQADRTRRRRTVPRARRR
jgi:TetR/AcrR family transcriptional repressor of nem operon